MNKTRRSEIQRLMKRISEQKDIFTDLADTLDEMHDEEEETRDNIPESLQNSERYEVSDHAVQAMEDAQACAEEILDQYENLISSLEEAMM